LENPLQQKCKILEENEEGHMKPLEWILHVPVYLFVYLVVIPAEFPPARYVVPEVATLIEAGFFVVILFFPTFI
jgi:hypothetical protein